MLNAFFNNFEIYTRIYPVLILIFPILLSLLKQIYIKNYDIVLFYLPLLVVLILISKIVRNNGYKHQSSMYKKLGDMPTTIILRFSDSRIDFITKRRYHKKLNDYIKGINLPIEKNKENEKSDVLYVSAINWLRVYVNYNIPKNTVVHQSLKEYNFWRNLYAMKIYSIVISVLVIVFEFLFYKLYLINLCTVNLSIVINNYYFIFFILVLILYQIFYVKKDLVINTGFNYAKSLVEICDYLK